MHFVSRICFFFTAALTVLIALQGADANSGIAPEERTALRARAAQMFSQTSDAQGVFEIKSDGGFGHIQSGAGCPLFVYGWKIKSLESRKSRLGPGADVRCLYEASQSGDEMIVSYFRVDDGVTLDALFEEAKADVQADALGLETVDPELTAPANNSNPHWADLRSAGFIIPPSKLGARLELVVGLVGNWAVEFRTTTFRGIHSERDAISESLFMQAPYSMFLLEAMAIHAHASGTSGANELRLDKPTSK